MVMISIIISGFHNDEKIITELYKHNFKVKNVLDKDTRFLVINKDLDEIQYKSSKIKSAIINNLPIYVWSGDDINSFIKQI